TIEHAEVLPSRQARVERLTHQLELANGFVTPIEPDERVEPLDRRLVRELSVREALPVLVEDLQRLRRQSLEPKRDRSTEQTRLLLERGDRIQASHRASRRGNWRRGFARRLRTPRGRRERDDGRARFVLFLFFFLFLRGLHLSGAGRLFGAARGVR